MTILQPEAQAEWVRQRWSLLAGLWRALDRAVQRAKQRRALRNMPDWQLHDIGVSRAEAAREADRPWWC